MNLTQMRAALAAAIDHEKPQGAQAAPQPAPQPAPKPAPLVVNLSQISNIPDGYRLMEYTGNVIPQSMHSSSQSARKIYVVDGKELNMPKAPSEFTFNSQAVPGIDMEVAQAQAAEAEAAEVVEVAAEVAQAAEAEAEAAAALEMEEDKLCFNRTPGCTVAGRHDTCSTWLQLGQRRKKQRV